MLRQWRELHLYHRNITLDNIIFDGTSTKVCDIGRDLFYGPKRVNYLPHFVDMAKRAYLCHQFGNMANNPYEIEKLKHLMKENLNSVNLIGFEAFIKLIDNNVDDNLHTNCFE